MGALPSVPLLASFDIALALLAVAFWAYEFRLWRERPADGRHLPSWIVALAVALYCVGMAAQYIVTDPVLARRSVQLQFVAVVVLCHGLVAFSTAVVGRRPPWPAMLEYGVGAGWIALTFGSEWVTPARISGLELAWLGKPYLQPASTVATTLFFISYLAMATVASVRVTRSATDREHARLFGAGLWIWVVCATVDAAAALGIVRIPLMVLEYGFTALAVGIVAVDLRRYGVLLRQAETSSEQANESFRAVVERTPLPAVVHCRGRIVYANPKAAQLLGVSEASRLVGKPAVSIVHPDDRDDALRRDSRVERTGEPADSRETRIVREDGSVAVMDMVAVPVTFEGESCILAMGQDVTEHRELTAKVMQVDRLIAVGTLAAGVAHEINNPLAYVTANIEFIDDELKLLIDREPGSPTAPAREADRRAELQQVLEETREGIRRVRSIVRDLTMFSRSTSEQHSEVDLRGVLDSAINVAMNEIRHRARLVRAYSSAPRVSGNEAKLGQVFLNLLVNAAQAIDEGRAEENVIRVVLRTDARGWAVVEVHDTGPGIPEEARGRLFEPFFTTKPVGQGTGLGLSICHGIVGAHGGEISLAGGGSAARARAQGSCFVVALPPMTAASAAAGPIDDLPAPHATVRRGTVLIVDDDEFVSAAARRILARDHEVTVAANGREALERLAQHGPFDVVLCDLMMPQMTGMQLHAEIAERFPEMAERMIFVTGGAFSPAAQSFVSVAGRSCLQKPLDAAALRDAVAARIDPPR